MEVDADVDLEAVIGTWARQGVTIDAYLWTDPYGRGSLHLGRLVVAKSLRGRGLGTAAMDDLTHLADHHGLLMTLSPSTDFGASSKERLRRFYKRFGFVDNRGRRKDFTLTASMYRLPAA